MNSSTRGQLQSQYEYKTIIHQNKTNKQEKKHNESIEIIQIQA
jgi:hypothetical protein